MTLQRLRREGAPVALAAYASLLLNTLQVRVARADEAAGAGVGDGSGAFQRGAGSNEPSPKGASEKGAATAAVRETVEQSAAATHVATPDMGAGGKSEPTTPVASASSPTVIAPTERHAAE